ncbi:3-hydroxybutyrate dehydrogenase [Brevibacterium senegalense]|uniref:3-hydroxybutyrate dehydrogenase n=1 Tax=Brevibacterium senegalense TaxID=1033736 RepID=UPI00037B6DF7
MLVNRRTLVTGGASGLGRAIALAFAREGAHVVIADRDGDGARAVAREIAEAAQTAAAGSDSAADSGAAGAGSAGSAEVWEVDLADTTALEERFAAQPLDVDILVNNAGIQRIHPVEEFPLEEWRFIQTLMLESPFVLTKAALPAMYARGWGRIINLSSIHGLRASVHKSAYVAAKHGLMGLTKTTALEGGPRGVTCNAINPGYVMTPLVESQVAELSQTRGISEDAVLDEVFLGHSAVPGLPDPEDVAAIAVLLASEAGRAINGAAHSIDGGWSAA